MSSSVVVSPAFSVSKYGTIILRMLRNIGTTVDILSVSSDAKPESGLGKKRRKRTNIPFPF
jgi:hypothetical protein